MVNFQFYLLKAIESFGCHCYQNYYPLSSVRNKQLPDCPTRVEIPSDNLRLPCACPPDNLKFWSVFLQFRSFSVISFTFYPVQLNAVIECIRCNEHSDWVDVIILTNQ